MTQTEEVYLPDSRVLPVAEKMYLKYPTLALNNTEFVTVRHEPPFTGQLPTGQVGKTEEVIIQFLVVSPHPRRFVYKRPGQKHVTVGTVFEKGWEQAEREYKSGHYVHTDKRDPLEVIYDGLCAKHVDDLYTLQSITN